MQVEQSRDRFLDALYTAAVGATGWKPVLEAFTSIVDAPVGAINIHFPDQARSNHAESLNTSGSFMRRSQEYWLAKEPWILKGYALVAQDPLHGFNGFAFHGASEVPTTELLESAWYRDFGREFEMQDCLALNARASEGHFITVSANTGGKNIRLFKAEAVTLAETLKQDFCRALGLHVQLFSKIACATIASQWGMSTLPVLVLQGGVIAHANAAAEAALAEGDIVSEAGARTRRIEFVDADLSDLARTHQHSTEGRHASTIATGRSGSRWLAQCVRFNRLAGSLLGNAGVEDPAVMLTLTPLDRHAAGRGEALQSLSLLTATEKQIAHCLLCGDRVADIARARRQSIQTIRWHMRNMISKTGSRNLTDLHRILALLLPS